MKCIHCGYSGDDFVPLVLDPESETILLICPDCKQLNTKKHN